MYAYPSLNIIKKNGKLLGQVFIPNLVATMLEAIMAFFPIKEEHEAIGAIDYSAEARKRYATASKKYKCELCGPIANQLPEKKEAEKIDKATESDIPVDGSDKGEDNVSDRSSLLKEEMSPDIKIKKNKGKKVDFDRRSHHPIEGIIFEDLNEDNENDDEDKLDKEIQLNKLRSETIGSIGRNEKKEMEVNDIKRSQSENNNFSDYLKKLRQEQFNENHDTQKQSPQEAAETLLLSNNIVNKQNHQPQPLKQINSLIKSTLEDELEYYDIQKSIKTHQSISQGDIMKDLLNEKINNILSLESMKYIRELNKLQDGPIPNQTTEEDKPKAILESMVKSNKNIKFEDLLRQKNIALKYFARKTYKESSSKRLRIGNLVTLILIILTFSIYIYYK
jgi:hypothetical protein